MNNARDQLLERPLPNSAEAERAILGAIILDNALISQAIEQLKPEDFYVPSHRRVFLSMIGLFERDSEINPILIAEELRREGEIESVGGLTFISNLTYGLPHFANITHYAEMVRSKSLLRQYAKECLRSADEALEEEDEPDIIQERHSQVLSMLHSQHGGIEHSAGLFTERSMGEWLASAALKPVPRRLFGEFWAEGELAIFFGDTGGGKSALAMQEAESICTGKSIAGFAMEAAPQSVLYFDFELTEMQLQKRYAVEQRADDRLWYDRHYGFSERFRRIEINSASNIFDSIANWEQTLISEMERKINASGAKIIIIDNITYLARETEKGKFALPLMQRLNDLKKQHGLSIKVLAHTPKRDDSRPLSLNDLAGSKILANFADSVYAIGKSSRDRNLRYLKQLKARSTDLIYGTDEVAVLRFEKTDNFLGFEYVCAASEYDHLKAPTDTDRSELIERVKVLAGQGRSQRAIARELSVSVGAVNKYLNPKSVHSVHSVHGVNTMNTVNTRPNGHQNCVIEYEEALI
jgi:replicative DNA helicase